MAETPHDKLKAANDDYHEAVGETLADDGVPVEDRTRFADEVQNAFVHMKLADDIIKGYYEE